MPNISAVLLVYCPAPNVSDSIAGLEWADEIVVWNASGKALEIESLPVCSIHAGNMEECIAQLQHDWVLMVEDHERLPDACRDVVLQAIVTNESPIFSWQHSAHFFGYPIQDPPGSHLSCVFHRKQYSWVQRWLREGGYRCCRDVLPTPLDFHIDSNIDILIERMHRKTSLVAQMQNQRQKRIRMYEILWQPMWRGMACFFRYRNYRMGIAGIIYSAFAAYEEFLLLTKMWYGQNHTGHDAFDGDI